MRRHVLNLTLNTYFDFNLFPHIRAISWTSTSDTLSLHGIMAEQFLLSMNDQLRKDERPTTFRAAIAFPVSGGGFVAFGEPDFPDVGPEPAETKTTEAVKEICFNCEQPGHVTKQCPRPRVRRCKNCGELGHFVSSCEKPLKCTICNSDKHHRYDCKETPKSNTKSKGHQKRDRTGEPSVEAELRFYLHPQHISHIALTLRIGYHREPTDTELTFSTIDMKLCYDNCTGIKATPATTNENAIKEYAQIFGISVNDLTTWAQSNGLYTVELGFSPSGSASVIGTNFFTRATFGEFTDRIERIRDFFTKLGIEHGSNTVIIRALTRSQAEIGIKADDFNAQLAEQAKCDPLQKWYNHGINIQLGMALAKDERPQYGLPAKTTFFSMEEYLTIFFYGVTDLHETINTSADWRHVHARFAALPFGGRKYIMFIEMQCDLRLTPGDMIKVSLDWQADQRDYDWMAEIIPPIPFATNQDYTAIVSRAYITENGDEEHFDDLELPKGSVLEVSSQDDTEAVREKITTMFPTQVKISLQVSTEPTRRQINALRQLHLGPSQGYNYKKIYNILTANNLRTLKPIDAFGHLVKLHGEDKLQEAIRAHCRNHNKEQQQADRSLRNLPGGLLMVQGCPGTGKTQWIIDTIAVCYSFANVEDPTQIVLLSGTNSPLDELAVAVHDRLLSIYNSDPKKYKFPVVIREHSIETEIRVYKQDEYGKRKGIVGTKAPAPIREEIDMSKLAVAQMLLQTYQRAISRKYDYINDRRVQQLDFSLGVWMLRAAGLRDFDGKRHPIAPDDEKQFHEIP